MSFTARHDTPPPCLLQSRFDETREDESPLAVVQGHAEANRLEEPTASVSAPVRPPLESAPEVRHPRGRILPPLPRESSPPKRLLRAVVRLAQGLHFHDALRIAPAMAFHFFLSLLPLLVFVGYVIALIARRKGINVVLGPLLDSLPTTTETIVKNEVTRLAGANRLGPLAALSFLWVASGGMQGLMNAVEAVIGAPRRAWWKQRLIALGWVVASLVAVGIASFGVIQWDEIVHPQSASASRPSSAPSTSPPPLVPAPDEIAHPERGARPHPSVDPRGASASTPESRSTRPQRLRGRLLRASGERGFAIVVSLALAVVGLAGFYRFSISHSKRIRRRVLPGAFLAVALWIVVTWGFSLYVRTLAEYAVFYGSLAAVAVLLVWLWLVSLSILVGAELNSQLEGIRD